MATFRHKFKILYMNLLKILSPKLRWFMAQKYEIEFWNNWLTDNPGGNDDKWLNTVLNYFKLIENQYFDGETIVDIGSGPIGILTKIKAKEKIAVDPLGIKSKDKTIKRLFGPGENIPLADESADRVFMYNVLQHVSSPEKVLEEGTRILKKGGTYYILEQLNLPTDEGHPNSLKIDMFEKWIKESNMGVIKKTKQDDCYFDHPSVPGSGYSILCLILRKKG